MRSQGYFEFKGSTIYSALLSIGERWAGVKLMVAGSSETKPAIL